MLFYFLYCDRYVCVNHSYAMNYLSLSSLLTFNANFEQRQIYCLVYQNCDFNWYFFWFWNYFNCSVYILGYLLLIFYLIYLLNFLHLLINCLSIFCLCCNHINSILYFYLKLFVLHSFSFLQCDFFYWYIDLLHLNQELLHFWVIILHEGYIDYPHFLYN